MDRQSLIGLTHYKNKDGILVIEAPSVQKANEIASEILLKYSDPKTALFLSGGKTPVKLYEKIAIDKKLRVGAVVLSDERFGDKLHKNSNELMIKNTGLLDYFEQQNLRFYPILEDKEIQESTKDFDEILRFLFKYFPKSAAITGLGNDGHTAGIPARNQKSKIKNQKSEDIVRRMIEDQSSLVSYYELEGYGERITMTFLGLSQIDLILLLVLGQEKREVLNSMFRYEDIEEEIGDFPAKFYLRPEIAEKVILITDQIV